MISNEAKALLSNPNYKQISLVSVVGKYRTGKSYLLNNILIKKKNAFKIGNTQKACTKGIWIYSNPIELNYHNKTMHVFFIDTEGLGAYDEEINHDTKIFMVAILISSLFIYNSSGTIDENSINTLSFIINLSKFLKISNNDNSSMNNSKNLEEYFPKLLWILRDFSLRLVDKNEKPISINDYLENALNQESNNEKIKVRKSIKEYFSYRECFALIRPVENEKDLQNLENSENLRKEFVEQCFELRNKVFSLLTPKSINGKILTGYNLSVFLEDIVSAINNGSIPIIENSWKYMIDLENISSLKNLTSNFIIKFKEYYYKELDLLKIQSINKNNGIQNTKTEHEQLVFSEKRYSPNNLNQSSRSNKDNEDSQTDSSILNSFNNLNQKYAVINNINFKEFLHNLDKEKKSLFESFLNNYINSEYTIITKNSEEYMNFSQKLLKSCEEEYLRFFNLEIEPTIVKIFSEKLEEISSNILLNYTNTKGINNFYKFIQDINFLLEELDFYPEFKNKQQIIINKILSLLKKYYEEVIVKDKNSFETEYFQLKVENNNLNNRVKKLSEEITSVEECSKIRIEEFNSTIFDLKSELISYKDLITLLESSRKDISDSYEKQIKDLDESYKLNLKSLQSSKEKIEIELRDNEMNMMNFKHQAERKISLNEQKIGLLSNEILELKNQNLSLTKTNNILEDEKFSIQNQLEIMSNKLKSLEADLKDEKQKRLVQSQQNSNLSNKTKNTNLNSFNKKNSLTNCTNSSVNVVNLNVPPTNNEITKLIKQNEFLKTQLDNSKQIYDDIIKNLRSSLQQKNHEYLKELNDKKIMESNKSLTSLLNNYEDRCYKLEEKLKKYTEYKNIVNGAETFQCKECFKQYSYSIFIKHISKCKQNLMHQRQKIKSIMEEEKKINAQVVMNINIEYTKKQEIILEVNHKKQIWSLTLQLRDFILLNEELRLKFANINFDYDFFDDNGITEFSYFDNLDDKQALTMNLNNYLKGVSNNQDLNNSDIFKRFVCFNDNYENINDLVDDENILQYEILDGLENTLVMTMTKNNFKDQSLSNVNGFKLNISNIKNNNLMDFNSTMNLLNNPIKKVIPELKLENIYNDKVEIEKLMNIHNLNDKYIDKNAFSKNNNNINSKNNKPIVIIPEEINILENNKIQSNNKNFFKNDSLFVEDSREYINTSNNLNAASEHKKAIKQMNIKNIVSGNKQLETKSMDFNYSSNERNIKEMNLKSIILKKETETKEIFNSPILSSIENNNVAVNKSESSINIKEGLKRKYSGKSQNN